MNQGRMSALERAYEQGREEGSDEERRKITTWLNSQLLNTDHELAVGRLADSIDAGEHLK